MAGEKDRTQRMKDMLEVFMKENPGLTRPSSENPVEIATFIVSNAPQETRSRWLKDVLEESLSGGQRSGFQTGTIALVLSALIIAAVIVYGIFIRDGFLELIANRDQARGLITFLFAFGTIAVILIISISVFWARIDEVEKRVGIAKDVLTILIGIFGTILGFYFGSVGDTGSAKDAKSPPTTQQQPVNQ